jgi:hypothetical protein
MRLVIRNSQGITRPDAIVSGDDSPLKSTWDEICVQVQSVEFIGWEVFDETVDVVVTYYVEELKSFEREALWFQTEAGQDWLFWDKEQSDISPKCCDDIVQYLKQEYIY